MADDPVIAADAVDPVPWAIHGAKHSADVARQNTYDSTGGAEGVSNPGALKVRATQTPSNQVRVAPGGALMLSPWDEGQTYNFRVAKEALVDVPASSSLGANTWFINAWVNDPNKPGGTTPDSVPFGPYAFLTCDAEPKGDFPHYTPAKIVVPADTATIEDDYITDLRKLAQPKRESVTLGRPSVRADVGPESDLATREADGGEYFPGGAGYFNVFRVDIPEWCTQIKIRPEWFSVRYAANKNVWGTRWMEYGTEYREHTWPGKQQYEFSTQRFQFDSGGGSTSRIDWSLIDTKTVPAKLRGQTVDFVFKAALNAGSELGVTMDIRSGLGCELTFIQEPVSDWEGAS